MARHTVVAMPGDGIGKVVLPEAVRVLDAVGFDAEYVHADIGWDFWISEGNALPERTIDLLREHRSACSAPSRPSRSATRRRSCEPRSSRARATSTTAPSSGCASISTWTSPCVRAGRSPAIR
jgi:isocitrate/isopropylmalate dehydrogenase